MPVFDLPELRGIPEALLAGLGTAGGKAAARRGFSPLVIPPIIKHALAREGTQPHRQNFSALQTDEMMI